MLYNKVGWFDVSLQSESVITGSDNTSRNASDIRVLISLLLFFFDCAISNRNMYFLPLFSWVQITLYPKLQLVLLTIIICPTCTVCGQKSPQY